MPVDGTYSDSASLRNRNKSEPEIWRPVPSEPGVLASSWGRFLLPPRHAPMPSGGYRLYQPKPRHGEVGRAKAGALHTYLIAMVYRTGEDAGRQRPRKVHQLVCEAFHGPRPFDGAVVIHINEDAHDNRPENLRWGTQKENLNMPKILAWKRSIRGDRHPRTVYSDETVQEIKRRVVAGEKMVDVARDYGVTGNVISALLSRRGGAQ